MINSINCDNSIISCSAYRHLQPLVRKLPLYILKTNDFINRINNFPVPPNLLLVAMDIKSLNTGIPNNKWITSVKKKYDHFPRKSYLLRI